MKAVVLVFGVASAVHEDRLAQIRAIQASPDVTWTASANTRFASEAPGASKNLCGVKDGWKERIQARIKEGTMLRSAMSPQISLPDEFDSETHWPQCAKVIGDIRD